MHTKKSIYAVGYASGIAARSATSGKGPGVMQQSAYLARLQDQGIDFHWLKMVGSGALKKPQSVLNTVAALCYELANAVASLVQKQHFFTVFGGDHSSGIGTWSGAKAGLAEGGKMGLIWVDAHMDSHTLATSHTGNIHGMPVACLLGRGEPALTRILNAPPILLPEHVCLVGIRRYEPEEADFLSSLNVRFIEMPEVKQRGLKDVFAEAYQIATQGTVGFGLSIDLDSIDPQEAPGTGYHEPGGLSAQELCETLTCLHNDAKLLGIEIAEFDPVLDIERKTEKIAADLLAAIVLGKKP